MIKIAPLSADVPARQKNPKPDDALGADVPRRTGDPSEFGVLLRLGELLPRIDEEWHRRKIKSRSETIRVLLKEALEG